MTSTILEQNQQTTYSQTKQSMTVLEIEKPNHFNTQSVTLPTPAPNEVLIKVQACGICGTDIHILKGEYLGDYPIVPGHEFSGDIVTIGNDITRFKQGDRVAVEPNISCGNCHFCLENKENFCENWSATGVTQQGGMAQYVCVPENAVFDIGPDLPYDYGAFVEPLSCVLHGIEKLNMSLAQRVLILGAGPIGCLLLQTVQLKGATHITVAEKNETRRNLAQSLGADALTNDFKSLKKDQFDVVIDATGVPFVMEKTIGLTKPGGSILLFGVPPVGETITLPAFDIFKKGLSLYSSYTSVRNSYQAVNLLKTGKINAEPLISHRFTLEEFDKAIHHITVKGDALKVLLTPEHGDTE